MRAIGIAVLLLFPLIAGAARAQTVERIAAVVNDDVVSVYDLKERTRLAIFSTGLEDTPELRRRIEQQVLRTLIDERLELEEAKRLNITVSKHDLDVGVRVIEQQNHVPKGTLANYLAENGVSFQTLLDQLRANIAWTRIVTLRLRPRISVGDDEVEEVMTRLRETQGQEEYRLSEIFLSVDSPNEDDAIHRTAQRLVEQIRGGARFDALARQFSQSATAAVGGDRGWTPRSELEPDIAAVVDKMHEGQVLDPVRTITGYRIISLVAKRKVAAPDPSQIKLSLQQLFVPIADAAAPAAVESRIDQAKSARASVESCKDIPTLASALGVEKAQDLGTLSLADLAPKMRAAVAGLEVGHASEPVRVPNGLVVLVVCKREAPPSALPDRDTIGKQILNHRLDLMARRYLRDLRRAAVIDVRV